MKRSLYPFLGICFLLLMIVRLQAQPTGYQYVRQITINESLVPDGADLNNFPLLFQTTSADLRSTANSGHIESSSGFDVLFYQDACSTPLDHELEYYNPTTGELAVWVRIPVLSTTTNTTIYMYYGNSAVTSSTSATTTWDASYSGIWHLSNDPTATAPQITDATGNGHNGTSFGSMTAANSVAGKIGLALHFDEVNDYVRIPDFLYGQELTVSFWFNASEVNGNSYQYLFSHGVWGAQNSLNVYLGEDNISIAAEIKNRKMLKSVFRDNNDANNFDTLDAGNTWIDGNWHYYTCRIQDWGGATIYIDGVQVAVYSVWGANTFNPATNIFLAAREDLNAGRFFGGMLDEVRISSVWRTSNWIRTEYNNQSSPASFAAAGSEILAAGFCFPLANNAIDFTATRSGNAVKLLWHAAAADTTQYIIERSINGNDWQTIATVNNAQAFTDYAAPASSLYYRVKRQSGSMLYTSAVKKVEAVTEGTAIKIYPNPSANGQFYINLPGIETPGEVMLFDQLGVLIKQVSLQKSQNGSWLLKTGRSLKKGIYFLRLQYNSSIQTRILVTE